MIKRLALISMFILCLIPQVNATPSTTKLLDNFTSKQFSVVCFGIEGFRKLIQNDFEIAFMARQNDDKFIVGLVSQVHDSIILLSATPGNEYCTLGEGTYDHTFQ